MAKNYDYAIIGAGLSGLSLALALQPYLRERNKRLLIVDKSFSGYAPRTWSFWEKGSGSFEQLVHHGWNNVRFYEQGKVLSKSISPYRYKSISSDAFRAFAFAELDKHANIDLREERIDTVKEVADKLVHIQGPEWDVYASMVFDSRFDADELDRYQGRKLWQQFKGWEIETKNDVFDEGIADMMDFRAPQEDAVAFFYVLPTAPNKALVEYTLFTEELKAPDVFDFMLLNYMLDKIKTTDYKVRATEEGLIPMTDYRFRQSNGRIVPIGTAGGCSKASSGYTFTFVQKQTAHIVEAIKKNKSPRLTAISGKRFAFYDRVLLRILSHYPEKGAQIFFRLFDKNKGAKIFEFLNNESSVIDEIGIFSTLPIGLFSKMAIRELFEKYRG